MINLKQLLNKDKQNEKDANLFAAFDEALRQVDELNPNDEKLAKDLKHLGLVYNLLNNSEQALKYLELALKMYKKLPGGDNHVDIADILGSMGVAYGRLGNYTEALKCLQPALEIQQVLHKEEAHDSVATALNNMGVAYGRLGNHAESFKYHQLSSR